MEMLNVTMPVNVHRRARKPAAVDQAGVVQLVAEERIVTTSQRTQDAKVRGKPAAEDQCRFGPFPICEGALQGSQRRKKAGDQRRSAGARDTPAGTAFSAR